MPQLSQTPLITREGYANIRRPRGMASVSWPCVHTSKQDVREKKQKLGTVWDSPGSPASVLEAKCHIQLASTLTRQTSQPLTQFLLHEEVYCKLVLERPNHEYFLPAHIQQGDKTLYHFYGVYLIQVSLYLLSIYCRSCSFKYMVLLT